VGDNLPKSVDVRLGIIKNEGSPAWTYITVRPHQALAYLTLPVYCCIPMERTIESFIYWTSTFA
jgi:hypothetical protein